MKCDKHAEALALGVKALEVEVGTVDRVVQVVDASYISLMVMSPLLIRSLPSDGARTAGRPR
jgi:hypothetical protein